MPKLFSLMQIVRQNKDGEESIPAKKVFDATVAEAKDFDRIKAARPATKAEIEAAAEAQAIADGIAGGEPVKVPATPASGAKSDPNG